MIGSGTVEREVSVNPRVHRVKGFPHYYAWGDPAAIPDFIGVPATGKPFAELWFGTHPLGPCTTDTGMALSDVLTSDNGHCDGLPFLVKYIAPAMPLSVQVHPSIQHAKRGFEAENKRGIALNAADRCFRDANHKPEMLYALTPWRALVGFAPREELVSFYQAVGDFHDESLLTYLESGHLERYVQHVLTRIDGQAVSRFIQRCKEVSNRFDDAIADRAQLACHVGNFFPDSAGVLIATAMNDVHLGPGQALFVPVGTIHAHLSGLGVEVMASSDNVIRAGLTHKHIDVDELLACATFSHTDPEILQPQVRTEAGMLYQSYVPPVDDFRVDVITVRGRCGCLATGSDTLLSCVAGTISLDGTDISCGETVFVSGGNILNVEGSGTLFSVTGQSIN